MYITLMAKNIIVTLILLLISINSYSQLNNKNTLPNIGSSTSNIISLEKELQIGNAMMQHITKS